MKKFEWSGILFYEVKGSIRQSSKVKLIAKDILLMDRGSNVHTSFNWDEEIVKYKVANPQARQWKMGHIHSHNTMSVFFSVEDWSELNDSCTEHNFYLSVIVNNFLEVEAKLVFPAHVDRMVCIDEAGKDYPLILSNPKESSLEAIMCIYECEIDMAKPAVIVEDKFMTRLTRMTQPSNDSKEAAKRQQQYGYGYPNNNPQHYPPRQLPPPVKTANSGYAPGYGPVQHQQPSNKGWIEDDTDWEKPWKDKSNMTAIEVLGETFGAYLLRMGQAVEEDRIGDAVDDLDTFDYNIEFLIRAMINNFEHLYNTFFTDVPKSRDRAFFNEVLDYIIRELKEKAKMCPWLDGLIEGLREIGVEAEAKYDANKNKPKVEEAETWQM